MTNTEKRLRDAWEDRVHGGRFVDKLYTFSPNSKVADDIADWWLEKTSQAVAEAEKKLLRTLLTECDRTENEGGRLLLTNYKLQVKK